MKMCLTFFPIVFQEGRELESHSQGREWEIHLREPNRPRRKQEQKPISGDLTVKSFVFNTHTHTHTFSYDCECQRLTDI